jgi:hypothetical protein
VPDARCSALLSYILEFFIIDFLQGNYPFVGEETRQIATLYFSSASLNFKEGDLVDVQDIYLRLVAMITSLWTNSLIISKKVTKADLNEVSKHLKLQYPSCK